MQKPRYRNAAEIVCRGTLDLLILKVVALGPVQIRDRTAA
jgi:hypothetical protein